MLRRLNTAFLFGSQVSFHFPKLHAFKNQSLANAALVTVLKHDSERVKELVPQSRHHAVNQGGHHFNYKDDHTEVIAGVKSNVYQSGAKTLRAVRQDTGSATLVIKDSDLEVSELAKFVSGVVQANYKFKIEGEEAIKKHQEEMQKGRYQQIHDLYVPEAHYNPIEQLYRLAYYKCYARELANQRDKYTTFFLEEAHQLFKDNSKVTVEALVGEELLREGMNLHHAVGRGAQHPPLMVNITYRGNPDDTTMYSFVGKGITFDTGGLHLKPYGSMETMYLDKCGACNVLAATRGAIEMNLKVNFTATIGMAENAIGSKAYKPSEILRSHKGLTVEINNTDAEGRLVLADCISWTQRRHNPSQTIEMSTLTGACWAALGDNTAGLFASDDELAQKLTQVGKEVNEELWRMPVTQEHHELMKGHSADLCNVGKGKVVGASKAAAFLFSFAEKKIPFVHLDIAGPCDAKSDKGVNAFGATGFGTQILLKYLIDNSQ